MNKRILMINREKKGMDVFTRMSPNDFVAALEKDEMSGFYGSYPDMKEIEQVKGQLHILGEEGCRILLGERTFYLRFGLSLLVFLAIFYFLVYLVPDPIPLVDEVAISLGAAILFSIWHRKRVERGERMVQKRIDVKGDIDRIEFKESPLLKEIELYMETLDSQSFSHLLNNWDRDRISFTSEDNTGIIPEMLKGIELRLGAAKLRRLSKLIKARVAHGNNKKNIDLETIAEKLVDDLSLAVFYIKYRKLIQKK